jgi:hypothetical protein
MLEVLIDTIFVICGGRAFQQTVGIPLGTKCAPLLPDLFPYSYAADFIKGILKKNEKKLSQSFNFTFRYIDDVLSINNSSMVSVSENLVESEWFFFNKIRYVLS